MGFNYDINQELENDIKYYNIIDDKLYNIKGDTINAKCSLLYYLDNQFEISEYEKLESFINVQIDIQTIERYPF